jgi:hypothetical protein
MSNVPIIKLPSSGKAVKFREATVEDCIAYCDLNEAFDEAMATEYLNSVQVGELSDSSLWTAQDRRLALWWIFITTSTDTTIAYEYPCGHCGEHHTQLVDLVDLDEEATSLRVKPYIDDEIQFNDVTRRIRLHPYNGLAMMHMEQHSIDHSDLEPDTTEYRKAAARLKLLEVAHAFTFTDEKEKDFDKALAKKLEAISLMSRTKEFPLLAAAVISALEKLEHGLNCRFVDGRISIVSPAMPCETVKDDKGEAMYSRLLIPFQCSAFIPTI